MQLCKFDVQGQRSRSQCDWILVWKACMDHASCIVSILPGTLCSLSSNYGAEPNIKLN